MSRSCVGARGRRATRAARRSARSRKASTSSWKASSSALATTSRLSSVTNSAASRARLPATRWPARRPSRKTRADLRPDDRAERVGEGLVPVGIEAAGQLLQRARQFGVAIDAQLADRRRRRAAEERQLRQQTAERSAHAKVGLGVAGRRADAQAGRRPRVIDSASAGASSSSSMRRPSSAAQAGAGVGIQRQQLRQRDSSARPAIGLSLPRRCALAHASILPRWLAHQARRCGCRPSVDTEPSAGSRSRAAAAEMSYQCGVDNCSARKRVIGGSPFRRSRRHAASSTRAGAVGDAERQ